VQKEVVDVSLSHDNTLLATAGMDRQIYVWDMGTGQLKTSLQGHTVSSTAGAGGMGSWVGLNVYSSVCVTMICACHGNGEMHGRR
jgi:WD40 repeat protein